MEIVIKKGNYTFPFRHQWECIDSTQWDLSISIIHVLYTVSKEQIGLRMVFNDDLYLKELNTHNIISLMKSLCFYSQMISILLISEPLLYTKSLSFLCENSHNFPKEYFYLLHGKEFVILLDQYTARTAIYNLVKI